MKEEWCQAAKPHMVLLGVGAAWTVLGLAFLAVGVAAVARGPGNIPAHFRVRAEGVVTGLVTGNGYDQLQVRFPGPGGKEVVTSVVRKRPQDGAAPRLGERVPLIYSVLEPERAHLEGHSFNRGLLVVPALFTLAGAALFAAGAGRTRRGLGTSPAIDRNRPPS